MRRDLSEIIKEWKNEAGVEDIILIGVYADFRDTIKICTNKPGWMIGKGGELLYKYKEKLKLINPHLKDIGIYDERYEVIMKLGDIYVNKKDKSIIQIDSYATHMGNFPEKSIVVFRQMERHNTYEIGSVLSFNGYGSREEIESEYELLVPQEKLKNYSDWNEIFDMVENSR